MSKKTHVFLKFCSTDLITFTKRQIPESCLNAGIYGKLPSLLWHPRRNARFLQCKKAQIKNPPQVHPPSMG